MNARARRFPGITAGISLLGTVLCFPVHAATPGSNCTDPGVDAGIPAIALSEIAGGLEQPVALVSAPGEPERLYVLEQEGRIRAVDADGLRAEPWLDISKRVRSGGERGLLGLAFHPDYARNGYFYVDYTAEPRGRLLTRISRFTRGSDGRADPGSERVLIEIDQPYGNHNGGQIAFGPDGMLYIAMGDGGAADDPHGNGQNLATLLAAILRIDVDAGTGGQAYGVPADNPFIATSGARPEIWAYGLRNPWRFSFDRGTGLLYAGDVGQNREEEIDVIVRGGNYGWSLVEGDLCHRGTPAQCKRKDLVAPILAYGRDDGVAVTGGYVYRGAAIAGLCGVYVYGDFGSGRVWGLRHADARTGARRELLRTGHGISSFGEDAAGELYLLDHRAGKVLRIVAPRAQGG